MSYDPHDYEDYHSYQDNVPGDQTSATISASATILFWFLIALVIALCTGCKEECGCGEILIYTVPANEHSILVDPTPPVPHVAVPESARVFL